MKIGWIIVILPVVCCAYVHRRVIRALIKHEEMPKAPKWHVRVEPENRRTEYTVQLYKTIPQLQDRFVLLSGAAMQAHRWTEEA